MTITISADDPRSIKALEIAAGASSWLKVRSHQGEVGFAIPSQCATKDGVYYLVTQSECDCQDFRRHGLGHVRIGEEGLHTDCKHMRAVQLHLELVRAQQTPRPKRRHLRAVPPITVTQAAHILGRL
jgi:hypothetical protein